MKDIAERLREVRCDREPFSPEHAKCVCRLSNEAADEIDHLRECLSRFSGLASSALAPLQIMEQEAAVILRRIEDQETV